MTTTDTTDISTDTATNSTANPDSTDTSTGTDTAAELEQWKKLARKHEDRAKANAAAAKELEQFKASTMTETEKAVNAARAEGLSEGSRKAGEKIARAEIRAAAAGRNVNIDALLEGIDPTRFLDEDGEPDTKAITAWVDRIAPAVDDAKPVRRDLGQGARGGQALALNGDPLLEHLKSKLGVS